MTQYSSWSESESGVTEETGRAPVGEEAAHDCEDSDASSSRAGRVIPKVQVARNRSDQRVPVYWNQTVPVWPSCKQVERASVKRKSAHTSNSCGECYHTVCLKTSPRSLASSNEEDASGRHATPISSKFSFGDLVD